MTNSVIGVTVKGIGDFSDVVSNVNSVQKALTKLKLPDKLGDSLNKNITNFTREYEKYQKKIAEGIHTQGDQNAVNKSLNSMLNSYEKIINDFGKLSKKDFKEIFNLDDSAFASVQKRIKEIQIEIKKIKLDPKQLTEPIDNISKLTKANSLFGSGKAFDKLKTAFKANEIEDAKKAITDIQAYYDRFSAKMSENKRLAFLTEFEKLKSYVNNADEATQKWSGDLNQLEKELSDIGGRGLKEVGELQDGLKGTSNAAQSVVAELKQLHANEFDFNRQAADISRQIQSYFGLTQIIRKVGDIARDAFTTVKELDAAMTQTAVVTNFSVSGMWDMLPTYTAQANQLGSTIKDVYEAATLYYQQGLNTNQAMGLANETLKMARIAGLGAAEATDMMTAALRGFNMEVNQMSAQKINDVYSELAAITASDTAEIGSAMERTASIANSANMEFETTSAFLAQMIETTREAPENLGTAMKTIVARFQEMKKDPTKLIDSEGVAMDANKVDTALKSIGVQLMNTKGEFRDLDDVFLDIASKWDSLSQGQQRYIATIAAGSRQQSRFIAMMSNYERTMELVDAANNSAGASQRQFEKTLDSMEAKLNKLKNAWDQFTMGLMNNQIIKFGIDALTEGFTVINKLIDALSKLGKPFGLEGLNKSLLTLVSTISLLRLGGRGASAVSGGVLSWLGGEGFSGGFGAGWKTPGRKALSNQGQEQSGKNKKRAEQSGFEDGQAYGKGFHRGSIKVNLKADKLGGTIKSAYTQLGKQAIGWDKYQENKMMASSPVRSMVDKLLPADAITAEATNQLQQAIDEAGGNVRLGVSNYKRKTGQGKFFTNQEAAELQKQYDEIQAKAGEGEGLEEGANKAEKLGASIENAGESLRNFGELLEGTPLEPFGNLLGTVGSLLMSFGSVIGWVGTTWTASITVAEGVTLSGFAAIKAGIAGLTEALMTSPIFWIVAAVAAIVGVIKLVDWAFESNAEKLEKAENAAAAASEAYDSAKQEASELADAISKIRETESTFDGLVAGTAEFNDQLVTANEQIMALIDKYPMLMDANKNYVTTDANGLMHISEAGFEAIKKYQEQTKAHASAMNLIQTADLSALENQQKAEELRKKVNGSRRGEMTEAEVKEHQKNLREADLLDQRAEAEVKLARTNAIRTTLAGKELRDVDSLTSVYTNLYDVKRKAAEAEVNSLNKHEIRQQYADYHGYTYDKSSQKITDIEGNEVDFDQEAIKDEVIEATVLLDFEANASTLEATLNNVDQRFADTLESTSEGSKHFISDVLSNNINTDEDLLKQALSGTDFQNAVNSMTEKEMAAILGITAESINSENINAKRDEIVNLLTDNASKIAEAQSESYENLATMMAQTHGWDTFHADYKTNQKKVQEEISDLTSEQAHMMSNIGGQLKEGAGVGVMQNYIGFMSDLYREVNQTKFGNIDLNNREIQKNLDDTISTVLGSSGTFGKEEIPIAFSPLLQTGTGKPIQLEEETVNEYINAVLEKAGKNASAEEILAIDANPEKYGLNVPEFQAAGHQIKGLIADIGDTAEETGTKMHAIEVDKEAVNEIEGIFEGVDLTSATNRLEVYNKMSASSIDTVKTLGEEMRSSADEANLLGKVFDEFLGGDWLDLVENADDFKNSLGQIDTAGILKASEQSHTLKTMLDSGEVSASGLAMALQGVEDGSIVSVNESVLQLLSSLNRLDDVVAEAHNIIQNFDAGIDTGEGEDFVQDNAKKAQEYYDNGEWGNQQLQNYIKLAAGQERWNEAVRASHGDFQAAEKDLIAYVTTFKDGFGPAWEQMIAGQGINGKSLVENIEASDISDELKTKFKQVRAYTDDEGYLNIDFGELSTEELELYYKIAYGVSQDYAKLLMQDLSNYDGTVSSLLAKNDLLKTVNSSTFQETHRDVNDNLIFTDVELDAFETAGGSLEELADAAGVAADTLREDAFSVMKDGKRRDDYGALLRDYTETYKTGERSLKGLFKDESLLTDGNLDLSKLITDTQAYKFDEEQAMHAAWYAYQRSEAYGEQTNYQGVNLEKGIETYEEFTASIESALESPKWESIGESIAQGIINFIEGNTDNKDPKNEGLTQEEANAKSAEESRETQQELANKQGEAIINFFNKVGEFLSSGHAEEDYVSKKDGGTGATPQTNVPKNDKTENGEKLDAAGDSLTNAAEQFVSGVQSLTTAGETLNTAGQNLTNAAAIIVANGQNGGNGGGGKTPLGSGGMPNLGGNNTTESSVSGVIVIDNSAALESLAKVKTEAEDTKATIDKGATFKVNVTGTRKLQKAAKDAANLTSKNGSSASIAVSTGAVNKDSVKEGISEINRSRATIIVDANTQVALWKARNLANTIDSYHAVIDVEARVRKTGISSITVDGKTVNVRASATGTNNHGYAPAPSVGSAARGGYGKLGPKGKGGLTLTGELGYEVAWLPSENRSMILGANGPQMIDLPGDAVVWTHEQSKKILKQKSIPIGSAGDGAKTGRKVSGDGGGSDSGSNKSSSNDSGYIPRTPKKDNSKKTDTIIQKAGKVVVWWDNYSRKLETLHRTAEKQLKKNDNLLKQIGMTITKFNKNSNVKDYKKSLQQTISLNKAAKQRAKGELNSLKTGKKYKGKRYSRQEISYEITKRDKNGKKQKETKNKTIDISKYIKKVGDDYIIDQKEINQVANKNKSKAESIASVVNRELNEKISNRNKAQDEIDKAKEAFEELASKVYEAFGGWEKSITHVYVLSKRLEELSTRKNLYDIQTEHELTRLKAGFGNPNKSSERVVKFLQKAADTMVKQVKTNVANVSATNKEYKDALSRQFYYSNYMELKKQGGNSTEAKNEWKTAKLGLNFLDSIGFNEKNFNYNTAVTKLLEKGYNNETYDKIKEFLDRIYEKQINYEQAIIDTYNSIDEIYNTIIEYREFISDFESEVLSGLEEQVEKEIEHLDKLNSSLTKAYKDLLDEVKNTLNARRKKEDNEKTETDLSKRMQRLALLRADTGGGHAVEIAQLEQEIADAQKDYQRSLEDQLLDKLQEQADKAEKQRERQIELLQVQTDLAKDTGKNLKLVTQWLANPEANEEKIKNAWLESQGFSEMSPKDQKKTLDEWKATWAQYKATVKALPTLVKAAENLEDKNLGKNDTLTKYEGNVLKYLRHMSENIDKTVNYNKGTKAKEYKETGASVREARKESKARGDILSYADLKRGGYDAADFKKDKIPAKKLKEQNVFSLKELAKGGYTYAELKSLYTDKDFKKSINAATARAIGMPPEKIAKLYGGSKALRKGNVGGAVVQKTNKFSATKIQKTINKNKKDAATQSDMAGVTTKMDINGKKKGGSKTGTISTSGKKIATNKGSRLYIQDWDKKKAKAAGKKTQKVYKAKELTTEIFNANKKEATDALVYAIKNTEPGKLINANSAKLFKLAGLQGKTYKLQNKITGTVGKNGIIYYNSGKKGVQKWDTAKGSKELEAFDKKTFIKKAKNKLVGKEYAQVLKKNGIKVKGYATGGLADYTGPAWLDGTPSKPELILSAQDTQNFIALKDVLSKAVNSMGSVENTYGNATYEININVDHLNNDYDVDKVVERVKKKIVQDSSYRNVTQVRKFR